MKEQRGIALVLAILVTSFLVAIGLGLTLIVMVEQLATTNLRGSVGMLYAADAAIELVSRELSLFEDWDLVLSGQVRSTFAHGAPPTEIARATNELNCGRPAPCTAAQMDASSPERPWGSNNARWHLFAFGALDNIAAFARPPEGVFAVWIADDGREDDANPAADAATGEPGHGVLRIRADAYGRAGARRAITAELVRYCLPGNAENCTKRIRVQSWQELRQAIP